MLRTQTQKLILYASIVFAVIAVSVGIGASTQGKKVLNRLGIVQASPKLAAADIMCKTAPNGLSKEVFFVSCGGFF